MKKHIVNSKQLSLCFASMVINGFYATSACLIMPLLRSEYGFSYQIGGMFLSALGVGNFIASFLAGFLPRLTGRKASAMALSFNSFLGYVLITLTGNPIWLLFFFFLIGISKGAVYNASNLAVLKRRENKTRNMNLLHASFAVGSLLCPIIISASSLFPARWHASCLLIAGVALCLQPIYWKSEFGEDTGSKANETQDWRFLRDGRFWAVTGVVFFEISTEVSVTGWLVSYFTDSGLMPVSLAQYMISVTWIFMLIGRFSTALLPIGTEYRKSVFTLLMSAGTVLFFTVMLFSGRTIPTVASLILFILSISGIQPTALSGLRQSNITPAAVSMLLSIGSAGGVIMPVAVGFVAQWAGVWAGMTFVELSAVAMLVCALADFLFRRTLSEEKSD